MTNCIFMRSDSTAFSEEARRNRNIATIFLLSSGFKWIDLIDSGEQEYITVSIEDMEFSRNMPFMSFFGGWAELISTEDYIKGIPYEQRAAPFDTYVPSRRELWHAQNNLSRVQWREKLREIHGSDNRFFWTVQVLLLQVVLRGAWNVQRISSDERAVGITIANTSGYGSSCSHYWVVDARPTVFEIASLLGRRPNV